MSTFIPDLKAAQTPIPYFESQGATIPGRATTKRQDALQEEIRLCLLRLGAYAVSFTPGKYPGRPERHGYRIEFMFSGVAGRIDCAALPIRHETPGKKDRALAQALFLVRNKLEATLYASVYEPNSIPLIGYLISPKSGQTVTEGLTSSGILPALTSGGK